MYQLVVKQVHLRLSNKFNIECTLAEVCTKWAS